MEFDQLLEQRAASLARVRARAAQLIEDLSRYPQDDPPTREVIEHDGKSKVFYNHAAIRKYAQWLLSASDEDLHKYADCKDDEHWDMVVFSSQSVN